MRLFYRNYGGVDYLLINLDFPIFRAGRNDTELGDRAFIAEVNFSTSIYTYKDADMFMISFKILGFGLSLTRQWAY